MNKVISLTYMYWSLLVLSFNNRRVLSFAYRSSSSSSLSKACYVPNHVFACCKKRRSINNLQQIASSSSTIQTSTRIRSTSDDSFFDDDDSRSRTHDDDDDDDDEYDNNKKNRELRFAGVGRYVKEKFLSEAESVHFPLPLCLSLNKRKCLPSIVVTVF